MIGGINHITLACRDVAASMAFYRAGLDARPLAAWPDGAYLQIGTLWLCLARQETVTPRSDYTHIAFDIGPDDFNTARECLEKAGARPWKTNTSEGASFYFLDPDDHRLEIHCGSWQSRLAHYRNNPPPGMIFY